MDREPLSKAIRRELEAQQISQGELAVRLRITPSTLRTWLHRNSFPQLAIKMIMQELDWKMSEDQVREKFEFESARATPRSMLYDSGSLRSAFAAADRDRERVASTMTPMTEIVEKLCSAMGEHDLLITISASVTPWEMERHIGQKMRDAIFQGVRKGGTYLYLRAEQKLADEYYEIWNFDRIRSEEDCRKEIESLRELIAGNLQKGGRSESEAMNQAIRATPQYFVRHDFPYLVPGFVIMMFRSAEHPGSEDDRLAVRLPDNAWATVYLTRADIFRDRIRRSVSKVLKRQEFDLSLERERIALEKTKQRGRPPDLEKQEANLIRNEATISRLLHMMDS